MTALSSKKAFHLIFFSIFVFPFLLFFSVTIGSQSFFFHDLQYLFLPRSKLNIDMLFSGELPWWNPWSFCGIPHFADSQSALFYPISWLYFIFEPQHALSLFILFHYSIAGLGMAKLGQYFRLSPTSSIVMAASYMFSGFMLGHSIHPSLQAGAAWLPWIFLFSLQLLSKFGWRYFLYLVFALIMQILSGHPQIPTYTLMGLALFCLNYFAFSQKKSTFKELIPLFSILLAYVIAALICAAQLLPLNEYLSLSQREAKQSYEFLTSGSLHISDLPLLIFPFLHGSLAETPFSTAIMHQTDNAVVLGESAIFIGVSSLVCVYFAFFFWLKRSSFVRIEFAKMHADLTRSCVLLLFLGVLIAFARYTEFSKLLAPIPFIGLLRDPSRGFILCIFSFSVLSGVGLHYREAAEPSEIKKAFSILGALTLFIIFISYLLLEKTPNISTQLSSYVFYIPIFIFLASIILFSVASRPVFKLLFSFLLVCELSIFAFYFQPSVQASDFLEEAESVSFLKNDKSIYRKATFINYSPASLKEAKELLFGAWNMVYGIADINGFSSLQPKYLSNILFSSSELTYGYFPLSKLTETARRFVNLLNVKYFIIPKNLNDIPQGNLRKAFENEKVIIFENQNALPRFFFVEEVQENSQEEILKKMLSTNSDFKNVAFIENSDLLKKNRFKKNCHYELLRYGYNQVEVRISSESECFMVMSDTFFPGWRAFINEKEIPIFRTNYFLRGFELASGEFTLKMRYQPTNILLSLGLSFLGVSVLTITLLIFRLKCSP